MVGLRRHFDFRKASLKNVMFAFFKFRAFHTSRHVSWSAALEKALHS